MQTTSTHRETLIQQLMAVFQQQGYEGATLSKLAAATGLGKASIYHHFPGGKDEIARVLMRRAIVEFERLAIARLRSNGAARERLKAFIDGFAEYVEGGRGHCLLAVLAQAGARPYFGAEITTQFGDWLRALTDIFEEIGEKPKRASRSASHLFDQMYGSLLVSKMLNDPKYFQRSMKRLRKSW